MAKRGFVLLFAVAFAQAHLYGQALSFPWSGLGHDPQHTALSSVPAQPLNRIRWQTPVDLQPQYSGSSLLVHYGSPLVTAANTVIIAVKTGASDGFKVEARSGADGSLKYSLASDYTTPPHNWLPSFGPVVSARNRLYYAGAGGTVYYRDQPDSNSGPSGQIAFYGNANYASNPSAFNSTVKISTPITSDRTGNIFFGYRVVGPNPLNLQSGFAKIAYNGVGTFITAFAAAGGDASITRVAMNCSPALSNDHRILYFGVAGGSGFGTGYLVSVDSRTMTPVARIRVKDPNTLGNGIIAEDGSSSPTVGPDGDVYYGILENPFPSHHGRGWLLHFNGALTQTKLPASFGWDITPSIVPSNLVSNYSGPSSYLLLTKYNNYAGAGGNSINHVAVLDPGVAMTDAYSSVQVMKEVFTVAGPTPDAEYAASFPGAVREWCINTTAIDPFTKAAFANSEDGRLYRLDFAARAITQSIKLTSGIGEAYTPTVIGVDGTVYAINNAILFAVGQ
ncbi:MAG: hypothetical protein EXQ52_05075 [Bryobacterales bacterium]|nr:hypothetical protein [Bryobacterales bacterium]